MQRQSVPFCPWQRIFDQKLGKSTQLIPRARRPVHNRQFRLISRAPIRAIFGHQTYPQDYGIRTLSLQRKVQQSVLAGNKLITPPRRAPPEAVQMRTTGALRPGRQISATGSRRHKRRLWHTTASKIAEWARRMFSSSIHGQNVPELWHAWFCGSTVPSIGNQPATKMPGIISFLFHCLRRKS